MSGHRLSSGGNEIDEATWTSPLGVATADLGTAFTPDRGKGTQQFRAPVRNVGNCEGVPVRDGDSDRGWVCVKNDIASGLHRVCRVPFAVVIVVAVVGSSITTADLARAGRFQVRCTPSHVARVDPIVSPREMSAHEHEFFGNRTTRATSTVRSMLRGRTTCTTRGDTAAYWSPTVYIGSDRIAARSLLIYYRGDARTVPFPLGLKVITDRFEYGTDAENLRFFFPDCWDGRRLDSRNHRSHMAFSRRERCPATHPLHVPEIVEVFRYPVSVAASTGAVYSSGPIATTAHADFWNTWKRKRLARLVRFCLNRSLDCGRVDNRRVP